jgi:hypothetical protein
MIENRGVWSKDGTTGSLGKVALFYHRSDCALPLPFDALCTRSVLSVTLCFKKISSGIGPAS